MQYNYAYSNLHIKLAKHTHPIAQMYNVAFSSTWLGKVIQVYGQDFDEIKKMSPGF